MRDHPPLDETRALARELRAARSGGYRQRLRSLLPYVVGAAMFAVALWVLHSTLARYELADLHAELAQLTRERLGLAVLFTGLSFMALVGYEHSALGLVGRRLPLPQLALASFITQSIAHSTGFAFIIGATLRYNFYAGRGLSIADVAKIQIYFTATFTLGVATLAGAVVMVEPWRLALATGLPSLVWRAGAGAALLAVIAYVAWGAFFHRPFRWRGRAFVLPSAGATLTQIFFGVTDLLAVAAALHVLLPAELGLGYVEVLAIFMASIVVGLMSHVPGSLGVFESAIILLVRPAEPQILPLVGALLAFRAIYYILPLICGVTLLTLTEMHRWRHPLRRMTAHLRVDLGPRAPHAAAALCVLAGLGLIAAALLPGSAGAGRTLTAGAAHDLGRSIRVAELLGGTGLLVLARGVARRLALSWQLGLLLVLAGAAVCMVAGESWLIALLLMLTALVLVLCRHEFSGPHRGPDSWLAVTWLLVAVVALASSFWLALRG